MDRISFLQLRNNVLEDFNNLESIMNITICHKYFGEIKREFMFPVLHSPQFTFALRIDVLSKIVSNFDKDIENKLHKMGNIRNLFAHISPNYFDNGEQMTSDKTGWFPNPDKPSERLDFEKVHKDFFELREKVLPYVVACAKGFGVPFTGKSEPTSFSLTDEKKNKEISSS